MTSRLVSITGATGFLGRHLCEAFQRDGWRVRAIVRPGNAKALPEGIEVVQAPLVSAWLRAALEGSDLVIHSAAAIRAPNEASFTAVNVGGTHAVVEAANVTSARLLHISSQAAAGTGTPTAPTREDDPPHPVNAYGRSKLASEEVVRAASRIPWTIVRPCAVYGPRDRGFLPLFRLATRGLFFYASPPSTRFTLIYIDDLVGAIRSAATHDRAVGQTFFLGNQVPSTTDEVLRAVAESVDRSYRPRYLAPVLLNIAASVGEVAWKLGRQPVIDRGRLRELRSIGFVCATDRARDLLGFRAAVSLRDGMDRTARWYREHQWL